MLIKYLLPALMLSSVWAGQNFSSSFLSKLGKVRKLDTPSTTEKPQIEQKIEYCGISKHDELRSELNTNDEAFAKFGEFPWSVAIYFKEAYLVAGSLLKRDFVLTTTKLIKYKNESELVIVAGDWDLASQSEEYPELMRTVNRTYTNGDITLIRLQQPLSWQQHIGFLCLPTPQDYFIWETAINTGWLKSNDQRKILRKKRFRIMAPIDCYFELPGNYKNQVFDKNSMNVSDLKYICAKDEMNLDSCTFNDGGALFYFEDVYGILAGIALPTDNCSRNNAAIFINIMFYINWIEEILEKN